MKRTPAMFTMLSIRWLVTDLCGLGQSNTARAEHPVFIDLDDDGVLQDSLTDLTNLKTTYGKDAQSTSMISLE